MQPFLLDGFKLDLRVYVLVTACNPLRIFVYKDGLVHKIRSLVDSVSQAIRYLGEVVNSDIYSTNR